MAERFAKRWKGKMATMMDDAKAEVLAIVLAGKWVVSFVG